MGVVLMAFIVFLLYYFSNVIKFLWKFYKLDFPSVGKSHPILGHFFMVCGLNDEERYNLILQMGINVKRVAKFWLGPLPVLGVRHPDVIQKILSVEDYLEKTPMFYQTFGINKSMISTTMAEWKPIRRVFNHSFNPSMLHRAIPIFAESSDRFVQTLSKHLDGSDFDLLQYVSLCKLDTLMEATYGIKKSQETKNQIYAKVIDAVEMIHTGISTRFNRPWLRFVCIYKRTELFRQVRAARHLAFGYQRKLYDLRKEFVLENREKFNKNLEDNEETIKSSRKMIDNLILNEHQFTPEEVRDNINQFLLAGFETTANQMCHIILMVAMHPEYQELAYQEIKDVFHSPDVEFNTETLAELKYTDQIIKEGMRLFAVGPFIMKSTTIDIEIDNQIVPEGTIIFIPIHLVHNNKEVWGPNADKFDPEHFSPENVEKRHPYAYMPFSLGKRNCLGYKFAMLSMKIMLAKLILAYKLSTDLKFNELRFSSKISLKLCTPYGIKLEKRE